MQKISTWLQQIGLYLFALFMLLSTAITHAALALMLLAAVLNYRSVWQSVKKQPLFYLSMAFVVFLLVRQSLGFVYPGGGLSDIKPWLYLSLFWLPGWALGQQQAQWRRVLVVVMLGFIIRLISGFDLEQIKLSLFNNHTYGFSPSAASIGFALYSATVLLGWSVWHKRLLSLLPPRLKWLGLIVWTLVAISVFEALVIANSRGAWVAVLAAFMVLAILVLPHVRKEAIPWRKIGLGMLAVALVMAINLQTMTKRVDSETHTYQTVLAGDLDKIPYSSAGLRIHMYAYAYKLFKQRPLLGWGAGSAPRLLAKAPDQHINSYPHFHSGYFEVLVQFGLVGVLFFTLMLVLLLKGLWQSYRQQPVEIEFSLFLIAAMVLMMVWNLFDVRLEHSDYRFYSLFMLGLAFAVINNNSKAVADG